MVHTLSSVDRKTNITVVLYYVKIFQISGNHWAVLVFSLDWCRIELGIGILQVIFSLFTYLRSSYKDKVEKQYFLLKMNAGYLLKMKQKRAQMSDWCSNIWRLNIEPNIFQFLPDFETQQSSYGEKRFAVLWGNYASSRHWIFLHAVCSNQNVHAHLVNNCSFYPDLLGKIRGYMTCCWNNLYKGNKSKNNYLGALDPECFIVRERAAYIR